MSEAGIRELLRRYYSGRLSEAEVLQCAEWIESHSDEELIPVLEEVWMGFEARESMHHENASVIFQKITGKPLPAKRIPLYRNRFLRLTAAAVFLLCVAGIWLYESKKPALNHVAQYAKIDVPPGHEGAVLTLSNGQKIVLDSTGNGTITKEGNLAVVKKDGALLYQPSTGERQQEILYNTVSTDRGRQWKLVLPDGTKVWLNAASSIYYPLQFTGKERVVEITGEAYFEVVHNSKQPFKVKAGNQTIEDIGTSFNVNAYTDEHAIQTTLVEGIVKVNNTLLQPGQQYANGSVASVNTDEVLAWKNGFFSVHDADIQTVMRQLARWYDVQVSYEGSLSRQTFTGKIDHNLTLSQVLNVLSDSKVHYRIEDRKHIVIIP